MNLIAKLSRRVVLGVSALVITASAVLVPLSAVKAETAPAATTSAVAIEGTIKVANVTAGDTTYKASVNAKVDEVVKVQLWYHNRENFDSGKVAKNLTTKITIPTAQGKAQTIGGMIKGDNTNTVNANATVNLSVDQASLEYIPGSAKWRHNKGADDGKAECKTGNSPVPTADPNHCYVTQQISDNVAKGGSGVRLEDLQPCFAHEATVTVLMRVKASAVAVNKLVSKNDGDTNVKNNNWTVTNTAAAGDKLDYMIRFQNAGNTKLEDVIVGDNLPDHMKYVPGSTRIFNSNHPDGIAAGTDNVAKGGINVGAYMPGTTGYVVFTVQLDSIKTFAKCGNYVLTNVGVVRPKGMNEFYNTAKTTVTIPCTPTTQTKLTCDALTVTRISNTKFKFATAYTATNATFKNVTYVVRNSAGQELSRSQSADYTQTAPGSYSVQAYVTATVNGQDQTVTSENCKKPFDVPTPGNIYVCEIATKAVVSIREADFNSSKYTKNLADCNQSTVTTTLPETGIDGTVALFAGAGLLTAGLGYASSSSRLRKLLIG